MAKFYCISPIGKESPDLFQTFIPTFTEQGHSFVSSVEEADVILYDLFSGICRCSEADALAIYGKGKPVVVFDETDFGGMSKEVWDNESWKVIRWVKKVIYFMRKMSRGVKYPGWVFPYEKTIQNSFPITTKEELCSRPYDFCFIGNESPTRRNVVKGLQDAGFKIDVHWTSEKGKISHEDWLNRHRRAKLFLESDGGGFASERPYQLFTISPMLRQKNNHLQVHPFKDYVNCLEVSEVPTKEEIEGIKAVLSDPDYLFEIYESGVEYMREHYSQEARSKYILSILKQEGII